MSRRMWLVTAVALVFGAVPGTAAATGVKCRSVEIPVALTAGKPVDAKIAGTLCRPRGHDRGVLQVLLPGGGYDRNYWSWRGDPRGPSYVEAMNRAGYATFALDRIGTGKSSAPPSSSYAPDTQVATVHQVLRALRPTARRIVLVGNSLGSTVARMIAVHYPADVDGLILTGESSTPNWPVFEQLGADYITASQHPKLKARKLDDGYGVLRPGVRGDWFYWKARAEVIARDEANPEPDVFPTDPEFGSVQLNSRIKVPTLVVVGQHDRLICGKDEGASDCSSSAALLAGERPYYPKETKLQALVVPDTGHVLNLHPTAPSLYYQLARWIS